MKISIPIASPLASRLLTDSYPDEVREKTMRDAFIGDDALFTALFLARSPGWFERKKKWRIFHRGMLGSAKKAGVTVFGLRALWGEVFNLLFWWKSVEWRVCNRDSIVKFNFFLVRSKDFFLFSNEKSFNTLGVFIVMVLQIHLYSVGSLNVRFEHSIHCFKRNFYLKFPLRVTAYGKHFITNNLFLMSFYFTIKIR